MRTLPLAGAVAALALGLALAARPGVAATDLVVNVPNVSGESVVTGFVGQIDANAISFGYRTAFDTGGRATGVVNGPITITKPVDKATPQLMNMGATLKIADTITVRAIAPNAAGNSVYLEVTLGSASITDWQLVEAANGMPGTEQVTFQARNVSVKYTTFKADGRPDATFSGGFGAK